MAVPSSITNALGLFLDPRSTLGISARRPIDRLREAVKRRQTSTVLAELALAKRSYDYGDHIGVHTLLRPFPRSDAPRLLNSSRDF